MKERELMEDPSQTTVALKTDKQIMLGEKFVGSCDFGDSWCEGLPVLGLRFLLPHQERNKELKAKEAGTERGAELAVLSGPGLKESIDLPKQRTLIGPLQLDRRH